MSTTAASDGDLFEPRYARSASGLLREFNLAGVLSAADVHVARRLATIAGEQDQSVLLAIALAVRAPRIGHVLVNLAQIRETAAVDTDEPVDLESLPWPDREQWIANVAGSPLIAARTQEGAPVRPLRLEGSWLYLDRYWAEEVQVARALLDMGGEPAAGVDLDALSQGLARLFGDERGGRQSLAAASAVLQRFAVVAGGPGTGKTTTVARIVALLCEQALAQGRALPLIALTAPTGKAAARLQEAVGAEALGLEVDARIREQLLDLRATTLHRLLGWRPGSNSRFRHDRNQRLPHDVVIVDETSMVSLSLMARLIEALRGGARLVLVGDPGQLASIEAGAVLGDIVGPAADRPLVGEGAARRLSRATGGEIEGRAESGFGDGIVVLERVHRFGGGIAELANAIRRGDADAVIGLLAEPPDDVRWIASDLEDDAALAPVREAALASAADVTRAALAGDARAALEALSSFRILCAHRRGRYGVSNWTSRLEGWLQDAIEGFAPGDRWHVGRPLLVTENDYELRLNNGDTGVVVASSGRVVAAFERGGELVHYSPTRLGAIDTVYAMTIHKSQGSQFDAAAVLLPEAGSRILTRELLYTAATRARRRLIVVGTEQVVRAAVDRPVARSSGLRWRLWEAPPAS
ncbi:MAG TPA: exodeoxyribonuclease V subunit alpha [Solirubrobacteraceae bacterium]|nr:exodeoxyribonuclease V subunit alpha [Solirubrobacteraceae bacterium]